MTQENLSILASCRPRAR